MMTTKSHGMSLAATAVLIASAGVGGCATSTPEPAVFSGDAAAQALTITIRNQQLDEARITLYIDGVRRPIGSVRGNQTETFTVRLNGVQTVRMEFNLTLGAQCVTREVAMRAGESVEVTIPSNLSQMAAVCRPGG